MTEPTTPATPQPHEGGAYVRLPDGSLQQTEGTAATPDDTPPEAPPAAPD